MKQGQKIAEVNFKEIKQKGYSIASPVVITNTNNYKNVLPILTKNSVVAEDDILSIEKEII